MEEITITKEQLYTIIKGSFKTGETTGLSGSLLPFHLYDQLQKKSLENAKKEAFKLIETSI